MKISHVLLCPILDPIIRQVASMIIIHENYNAHRQTNDIAIVKLEEKLNFTNVRLGAVCLPDQFETYSSDGSLTV